MQLACIALVILLLKVNRSRFPPTLVLLNRDLCYPVKQGWPFI